MSYFLNLFYLCPNMEVSVKISFAITGIISNPVAHKKKQNTNATKNYCVNPVTGCHLIPLKPFLKMRATGVEPAPSPVGGG
jgi:hypothetical protein